MRPHPFILVLPTLTFAACLDGGPPAAVEGDFSCVATPWPTVAADPMMASGQVVNEVGGAGVSGAWVEIRNVVDDTLLAEAGTGDAPAGSYAASVATGGTAPIAYRKVTADGYLDGYEYDPAPMTGDSQLQVMLTPEVADHLYQSGGLARDSSSGTVLISVTDCAGHAVRGATVSVPAAARVLYLGDDTQYHPEATSTSGDSAAMLLGVPAGLVDVTVRAGDVTYRPLPIVSRAGGLVTSTRRP